jgi:hypothetical protein
MSTLKANTMNASNGFIDGMPKELAVDERRGLAVLSGRDGRRQKATALLDVLDALSRTTSDNWG